MISLYFLNVFIENYCPFIKFDNSKGTGEKYNGSYEDSAETTAAFRNLFLKDNKGGADRGLI